MRLYADICMYRGVRDDCACVEVLAYVPLADRKPNQTLSQNPPIGGDAWVIVRVNVRVYVF